MHERGLVRRLEGLYGVAWDGLPIGVDVVETVNAQGANSIIPEPRGHLLVSRTCEGPVALDIVLHEASHLLMRRGDPVQRALAAAAAARDAPVPDDLWHVVLFYTTGESVRRALQRAGTAGYHPLIYEIYERSSWARYRDAIDATWPAYMSGERTLSQAAADLIDAILAARTAPWLP